MAIHCKKEFKEPEMFALSLTELRVELSKVLERLKKSLVEEHKQR